MKENVNLRRVILILIILILICINLILILKGMNIEDKNLNINQVNSNNNEVNEINQTKSEEEQELEKLQAMTERDRMEYYFSKFISYIKDEKYTEAYDLLYPEFKQNYFKTVEEFRDYAKKTYPSSVGFSYNDIERQGDIYVLVITVIDTNKKVGEEKSQRIVIQENNFNDFVLSFQVI